MNMNEGRRVGNTRANNRPAERAERTPKQPIILPFSMYSPAPDVDGVVFRHLAPATYNCAKVSIYIDGTSGVRMQLGVDGTEFIERDMAAGINVFEVGRSIPEGSRVKLKVVSGSAIGVWASWIGEVRA